MREESKIDSNCGDSGDQMKVPRVVSWTAKLFQCAMSSGQEHLVAMALLAQGSDARARRRYWRFDPPLDTVPSVSEVRPEIIHEMTASLHAYIATCAGDIEELAQELIR